MKRLCAALFGLAVVASAGCEKGSSTAPGTGRGTVTKSTHADGTTTTTKAEGSDSPRKLTVRAMGEQTVTQDRTDEMTVYIDRDNFDGAVEVMVENLPKGVTVTTQDKMIPAGKDSLKVTLKAAADAAPVDNHKVKVMAKAKDQADLPPASLEFDLDVKAK